MMDKKIQLKDRINIFYRTGKKFVKGCFIRLFLKETHGMLLVGKGVQISHGKHIRCGKNVKFEDYAEILTFLMSPEELVQVKKEDRGRKCIEVVENFSKQAASAAGLSLRLSDNNVKAESFSEVASRAVNDGAIIVNPKAASKEDVLEILKSAF